MPVSSLTRRLSVLLPLVVALSSCDLAAPTAPAEQLAPVAGVSQAKGHSYRVVSRPQPIPYDVTVKQLITPLGGVVRLGDNELRVPLGAVRHPTLFIVTAIVGKEVIVDLKAVDQVTGENITQFKLPLQVRLSYAQLPVARADAHKLLIVWLKDESADGELVAERSTMIPGERYVIGWVTHFSRFAMAM